MVLEERREAAAAAAAAAEEVAKSRRRECECDLGQPQRSCVKREEEEEEEAHLMVSPVASTKEEMADSTGMNAHSFCSSPCLQVAEVRLDAVGLVRQFKNE